MDKLQKAVTAIKAGDKETGQALLIETIETDDSNEQAWLWLTQTTNDKAEQIEILEKVLEINPDNPHAKKGLAQLRPASPAKKKLKKLSPKPVQKKPTPPPKPQVQQSTSPAPVTNKSDRQLIQNAIALYTSRGWQVISQTEDSVQLRKPKEWSKTLLGLGCITIVLFGAGLVILIVAAIDYALKKEQVIYLTADQLRHNPDVTKPPRNLAIPIIVGLILVIFALCSLLSLISSFNSPPPAPEAAATATSSSTSQPETPTTEPTLDRVGEYALTVVTAVNEIDKASLEATNLLDNFNLSDEQWREDLILEFTIIRAAHETITNATPPDEFREPHDTLLGMSTFCNEAIDEIATGIDNRDVDEVALGIEQMRTCQELAKIAINAMNE